jgi:hypothetical protein
VQMFGNWIPDDLKTAFLCGQSKFAPQLLDRGKKAYLKVCSGERSRNCRTHLLRSVSAAAREGLIEELVADCAWIAI